MLLQAIAIGSMFSVGGTGLVSDGCVHVAAGVQVGIENNDSLEVQLLLTNLKTHFVLRQIFHFNWFVRFCN